MVLTNTVFRSDDGLFSHLFSLLISAISWFFFSRLSGFYSFLHSMRLVFGRWEGCGALVVRTNKRDIGVGMTQICVERNFGSRSSAKLADLCEIPQLDVAGWPRRKRSIIQAGLVKTLYGARGSMLSFIILTRRSETLEDYRTNDPKPRHCSACFRSFFTQPTPPRVFCTGRLK